MKNTLLEDLKKSMRFNEKQLKSVVFEDSSNLSESSNVNLNTMKNRLHARNNCWSASEAAMETLDFSGYGEAQLSGIQTPAGNHYAILVNRKEDAVIVDFTARQFDDTASFPLVMDAWKWQDWVEAKIGRMGHWAHDTSMMEY